MDIITKTEDKQWCTPHYTEN